MGDEAALAPGRRLFLSSWRQVFAAPVPPFSGSMKPTRRAGARHLTRLLMFLRGRAERYA